MKKYNLAVIGATGLVGKTFLKILDEFNFPINNLYLFASSKSAGKEVQFKNKKYIVEELTENSFNKNINIALFSAGGNISKKFVPLAASKNCIAIDNSSVWRMEKNVPLIVPEVNKEDIKHHNGIISNPNCSTIQAVVVLKPLHDKYKLKRIVYSTYQAVSGAGLKGIDDLKNGLKGKNNEKFPHPIAGNCIPHIDEFLENGYTKEELKMINETRKILNCPNLAITATTVRVPIINCHSEAINIEFEKNFILEDIINILENTEGIVVQNDHKKNIYPMPINVTNKNEVYVGRIRRDYSVENGLNIWVVADNIRKGAATNAVQIAEALVKYQK